MDLATATPVQIDSRIAELGGEYAKLVEQHGWAANSAHSLNGERAVYKGKKRVYTTPLDQTLTELMRKFDNKEIALHERGQVVDCIKQINQLDKALMNTGTAIDELEIEYARRPWSRFITVENGHLHSGRRCEGGTIRSTTVLGWHPELSGKTEAEAVAELGPLLCTHCFPTAPVEWTVGAAKKKTADGYCDGQGEQGINLQMEYVTPRGRCPKCKQGTGISKTGKVLKHKLPKS